MDPMPLQLRLEPDMVEPAQCRPHLQQGAPTPDETDHDATEALRLLGSLSRDLAAMSQAEWRHLECYARAHRTGYLPGMAEAASRLGECALDQDLPDEAEARFHVARRLAWAAGNERLAGSVELGLGSVARARGDLDGAIAHHRKAAAQFRATGDDGRLATALKNVGRLHAQAGDRAAAEQSFHEAIMTARRSEDLVLENSIRVHLAELRLGCGDLDGAGEACGQARTLAQERRDLLGEARAIMIRGVIARERGEFEPAARDLAEAAALAWAGDDRFLMAEVACEAGELHARQRNTDEARGAFARALELFEAIGARENQDEVARRLAGIAA